MMVVVAAPGPEGGMQIPMRGGDGGMHIPMGGGGSDDAGGGAAGADAPGPDGGVHIPMAGVVAATLAAAPPPTPSGNSMLPSAPPQEDAVAKPLPAHPVAVWTATLLVVSVLAAFGAGVWAALCLTPEWVG